MKVFGKQGDNYIVSIPKRELLQIVFGETYPENSSSKHKSDVNDFCEKIDRVEVEVQASKIFEKMMSLHSLDLNDNYNGLLAKIDALRGLVTPINDYIRERKPKTE